MANQSSIQFNNYYIFAGRIKVSATFFFLSRNMSVLFDELTIYKNEEYYGKRERESTSSIPGMLNLIHIFNRTLRSIHSDSIVLVDQSIQLNICLCVCVCLFLYVEYIGFVLLYAQFIVYRLMSRISLQVNELMIIEPFLHTEYGIMIFCYYRYHPLS